MRSEAARQRRASTNPSKSQSGRLVATMESAISENAQELRSISWQFCGTKCDRMPSAERTQSVRSDSGFAEETFTQVRTDIFNLALGRTSGNKVRAAAA